MSIIRKSRTSQVFHSLIILFAMMFFGFCPQDSFAQNYRFERFQGDEWQSLSNHFDLYQDSLGYLWMGTSEGLVRYDGYEVKRYQYDPGDSNSIPANDVNCLAPSAGGRIWIGSSSNGICRFSPNQDRFTRFASSLDAQQVPLRIHNIYEDPQKRIWLATIHNLWVGIPVEEQPDSFVFREVALPMNPENEGDYVSKVMPGQENELWALTRNGVWEFEMEENIAPVPGKWAPKNFRKHFSRQYFTGVTRDHEGGIWIGGRDSLFTRRAGETRFRAYSLEGQGIKAPGPVLSIVEDREGRMWVGSRAGGVQVFDFKDTLNHRIRTQQFLPIPGDNRSISSSTIRDILEDQGNNLWFATHDGLARFNKQSIQFNNTNFILPKGLPRLNNDCWAITKWKEKIWVGTRAGLVKYDPQTGEAQQFQINPKNPAHPQLNSLRSVFPSQKGHLWVSGITGITKFDPKTGVFTPWPENMEERKKINPAKSYKIIENPDGQVWVAGAAGLFRWSDETQIVEQVVINEDQEFEGGSIPVKNLFPDSKGNLWIASELGLKMIPGSDLHKPKPSIQTWTHSQNDAQSLSNNSVRCISQGNDLNTLWVGTDGGGLNALNLESGKFTRYTTKDGLPNNMIYHIEVAQSGEVWVSTNLGLAGLNPETGKIRHFLERDGLQNNEFNVRCGFQDEAGWMYFGGRAGFNFFHPDSLKPNPTSPKVVFSEFFVQNQPSRFPKSEYLTAPLVSGQTITLPWSENILGFSFSALDYTFPEGNQYAYRLLGFSRDWIELGSDHRITFTNLDPGHYTLEVKAKSHHGNWSPHQASLFLVITPPWWRTWWAYSIYVLILLGIAYLIYRTARNRIRMQEALRYQRMEAAQLREVEQLKSRFFTNVSHELRTPVSLLLGPLRGLKARIKGTEDQETLEMMERNGERLLKLLNQLLLTARMESGMETFQGDVQDLAIFTWQITYNFEEGFRSKKIELKKSGPEKGVFVEIDSEKMENILYNLLSNALKFTPEGGKVAIEISQTKNSAQVLIRDSGPGIPVEDQQQVFERFYKSGDGKTPDSSGIGLSLVKELVELHQGEISLKSSPGQGAKFKLNFPLAMEEPQNQTIEKKPGLEATSESKGELPVLLVVEDNQDLRNFIARELKGKFQVLLAENGKAGLQAAREHIPDLIVSDVMMPVMDGMGLLKGIREDLLTRHIPVLLLTAKATRTDQVSGLREGADDYLPKPFDPEVLRLKLKNLLRLRADWARHFEENGLKRIQEPEAPAPPEIDPFVAKVIESIEENLDDNRMSVEELAKTVGVSGKQLQRKLKSITGKTPNQMIRAVRLSHARNQLLNTELTVAEIGYAVGFSSPSYFTKVFQEEVGETPSAFRERQSGKMV